MKTEKPQKAGRIFESLQKTVICPAEPKFIKSDGGRCLSRRPMQKKDCTVIALAIAAIVNYDEAYDFLASHGRRCSKGFPGWSGFMNRQTEIFGKRIVPHPFPPQKGEPQMNGRLFVRRFPRGRFIVKQSGHVAAVVDGVIFDSSDFEFSSCIYTAHEFVSIEK